MPHLPDTIHLTAHNDVLDENGKLLRGTYEGWDCAQVVVSDPGYLHYILDTWDISDEDIIIIQANLRRED